MKDEASKTKVEKGTVKRLLGKFAAKKPLFSIISIFFIVVICLMLSFSKETIKDYESAIVKKGQELLGIEDKTPCAEGWNFFNHDVIGISFCYPKEWGNATTDPKQPITRLEGLVDEFDVEDNYYHNSFAINFDKNENVQLRFFNEEYGGEKYPNAYAYQYGYVDNIDKLKISGNICDYKMDFNHTWQYEGKINETYATCDSTIKTAIIDKQEYFDKEVHISDLKSFAYAKLSNGYFDNVLLTYAYGGTTQLERKFDAVGPLLAEIKKSEEDFAAEQEKFESFVKSIKTFLPVDEQQEEFVVESGEDEGITAIRRYYWLIAGRKFDEAYAMKAPENRGTYEEFLKQYKNVYIANPYDFQKIGGNGYSFLVEYEDHNEPKTKYGVKMTVADGKLTTTFVEEFKDKSASFGEYTAFAVNRGGKSQLILKKGENEKIVDEGDAEYNEDFSNIGEVKSFSQIKFSDNGNYLIYTMSGYEWIVSYIYDVREAKTLKGFDSAYVGEGFGVTPDEKYLYVCAGAGMTEGNPGEVYTLPGMVKVFDAGGEKYFDRKCRYEKSENAIVFNLSGPSGEEEPKPEEVKYYLDK